MREIIESYVGMLVICIIFLLTIAFTSINMHTIRARKIYNDICAEVQASNGAVVPSDTNEFVYGDNNIDLMRAGYDFKYRVRRISATGTNNKSEHNETFMYNDLYEVYLVYVYNVPLFGMQYYPMKGHVI